MDCFDRDEETRQLWAHFKGGRNVLMLAPRRTGKTLLLERLRNESEAEGFHGIVLDVEGFSEEKDFFRQLCAAIQEDIGIGQSLLAALGGRLKQAIRGTETAAEDWRQLLLHLDWQLFAEHLLAQLEEPKDGKQWLFLVDEITIFVQALLHRHGQERAAELLYALRRLARAHPRIQWLMTGSIGLDTLARRHGFEGALVDLEIFTLGPFDRATAAAFVEHVSRRHRRAITGEAVDLLLDRLGWLSPFYLEKLTGLACRKGEAGPVGPEQVAAAAGELLGVAYRTYWSTWREHLDKNFIDPERGRLFTILATLCRLPEGAGRGTVLAALHSGDGAQVGERALLDALDTLEADGYLTASELTATGTRWRFRMNLLREWWARYVAPPAAR